MRAPTQMKTTDNKSHLSQQTGQPSEVTKTSQTNPLVQQVSRMGNSPNPSVHAAVLNRAPANQQSSNQQLLLQLQRQYGNGYVNQVLQLSQQNDGKTAKASTQKPVIQAKLTVNPAGDKYEQEADQVADKVVQRMNAPAADVSGGKTIQRQEMPSQKDEEEKVAQTKPEISSLQRMTPEPEEEDKTAQTKPEISSIQRQGMTAEEEEEEQTAQTKPEISSIQRQEITPEEEEEQTAQTKPEISSIQRQQMTPEEEEEDKTAQTKPEINSLQRQGMTSEEEEEEQTAQTKPEINTLQRQGMTSEEEEEEQTAQTKPEINTLQRQEMTSEEEEEEQTAQTKPEINSLQRQEMTPEPEEEEDKPVQMKSANQSQGQKTATADLEASVQNQRGRGQPINDNVRGQLEQGFGADFSGVRIHTDGKSDELNQSIQARAFTTGQDIFFRQGAYDTSSKQGQQLLAHELTHVVQQSSGAVQTKSDVNLVPKDNKINTKASNQKPIVQAKLTVNSAGDKYEQEADRVAEKVVQRMNAPAADVSGSEIQRQPINDNNVLGHLEQGFEADFSGVRTHTDAKSDINLAPKENKIQRTALNTISLVNSQVIQRQENKEEQTEPDKQLEPTQPGQKADAATGEGQPPADDSNTGNQSSPSDSGTASQPPTDGTSAGEPTGNQAPAGGESGSTLQGTPVGAKGGSDQAPTSPDEDPAFQEVVNATQELTTQQQEHPPGTEKADEAQAAAEPPANEVESKAQANQVEEMQQAETPEFDAAALKEKLMQRIADLAPKTLEEADEFENNNKLDSVKDELNDNVKQEKDASQGQLEEKTEETPDTSGIEPKPVEPLPQQDSEKSPRNTNAKKAAPKSKGKSEVEAPLKQDSQKLDQQLVENNVTEEQLKKSNEPEFQAALQSKEQAQTHAGKAPAKYRQSEQDLISNAQATAVATAQEKTQEMQDVRTQQFDEVRQQQEGTKSKDEQARAKIADDINQIYEDTKTKVDTILSDLDTKVIQAFDEGANEANKAFEDYVNERMEAYKEERYGGWDGWLRWLKDLFLGMPDEVNAFYEEGQDIFIDQMNGVIDNVVQIMSEGLTAAKTEINNGKQEIQNYIDKLPDDLKAVGQEAAAEIEGKFDELEQSVDNKQDELIDTLANKYQEHLNAVDARIAEMKEANKGFVQKAIEYISDVVQTIIEMGKLLLQVLARVAHVVGQILQDPIGFLKNLIAGLTQGFENFIKNILKHLKQGFISWLTGTLAGAGIEMPESFDLPGIFSLVVQILGFTPEMIEERVMERAAGGEQQQSSPSPQKSKGAGKGKKGGTQKQTGQTEQANDAGQNTAANAPSSEQSTATESSIANNNQADAGIDVLNILSTQGIAGLWQVVQDQIGDLKAMVLDQIQTFLIETVIKAGIEWIISLMSPASAFVKACKLIYEIIKFFIERAEQIVDLINAILDSVEAIVGGKLAEAAKKVEEALAKAIPVVIGFLASLLGLGGLADKVQEIIEKVRATIEKAIDWVIEQGAKAARKVGKKSKGKSGKDKQKDKGKPSDKTRGEKGKDNKDKKTKDGKPDKRTDKQKKADLRKAVVEAEKIIEQQGATPESVKAKLPKLQTKYRLKSVDLLKTGNNIYYVKLEINPIEQTENYININEKIIGENASKENLNQPIFGTIFSNKKNVLDILKQRENIKTSLSSENSGIQEEKKNEMNQKLSQAYEDIYVAAENLVKVYDYAKKQTEDSKKPNTNRVIRLPPNRVLYIQKKVNNKLQEDFYPKYQEAKEKVNELSSRTFKKFETALEAQQNSAFYHTGENKEDAIPVVWYKKQEDYEPIKIAVSQKRNIKGERIIKEEYKFGESKALTVEGKRGEKYIIQVEQAAKRLAKGQVFQNLKENTSRETQQDINEGIKEITGNKNYFDDKDGDHIVDLGFGGKDAADNYWPLKRSINQRPFHGWRSNYGINYKSKSNKNNEVKTLALGALQNKWFKIKDFITGNNNVPAEGRGEKASAPWSGTKYSNQNEWDNAVSLSQSQRERGSSEDGAEVKEIGEKLKEIKPEDEDKMSVTPGSGDGFKKKDTVRERESNSDTDRESSNKNSNKKLRKKF